MNRKFVFPKIFFMMLLFWSILPGQGDLSINGYIRTYNRIRFDSGAFTWNENRLNLRFEGAPSDKYHYFSEVRLRGFGFPDVSTSSDLQRQKKDMVYTWGIEFREAYVDLYGFGLENLDIRIGRQIINWGTADLINPTGNISPDDLEDLFDFGVHLGTNALKADYYFDDLTLTGIYIPVFTPAVLPFGDYANAFVPEFNLPPNMIVNSFSDRIILPDNRIGETSQFAFKAAGELFGYDVSVSYYYGRDDLPIANSVTILPLDAQGNVDLESTLIFPKFQVIGADFSGSLGSAGFWGEGALFIPEKVDMNVYLQTAGGNLPIDQSVALDSKPYFKYVLGTDYTFKSGWYINAQFIHGFIHERGVGELNDYIAFSLEKKFFNDELKIVPFGAMAVVTDWTDIGGNYGIAGVPEINYYFTDNIEIDLGAFLIFGDGDNMFSRITGQDEFFFKVKVSF